MKVMKNVHTALVMPRNQACGRASEDCDGVGRDGGRDAHCKRNEKVDAENPLHECAQWIVLFSLAHFFELLSMSEPQLAQHHWWWRKCFVDYCMQVKLSG